MSIVNELRLEDYVIKFAQALSDANGCSLDDVRKAMRLYLCKCDWSSGDRLVDIFLLGLSKDEVSELQKPIHVSVSK